MMLKVKLLAEDAKAPTVAHPGEDLAYDLYALSDHALTPGTVHKVRTGIAVDGGLGFLIKDRSSMAAAGFFTHGGVIDPGYRGEIMILFTATHEGSRIRKHDKIAQMVPVPALTSEVEVVDALTEAARGEKGFGSSGR
jgi:dUTP pyrophosphatase